MDISLGWKAAVRAAQNFKQSFAPAEEKQLQAPELFQKGEPKDWTVLVYMDGRNGLAASSQAALRAMARVGSSDNLNLVAQVTQEPTLKERLLPGMGPVPTRRYYVQQNNPAVVHQESESDKMSVETLADFVSWGMQKFPAKNTLVVVKRHGEGFLGGEGVVPLSAPQIREALELAEQQTGKKPSVLSFDSCAMGQSEVAYELRDRAQVMTGSASDVVAADYPYAKVLSWMRDNATELTPEHVGHLIVEGHKQAAPQSIQTAVDLTQQAALAGAVKNLVNAIIQEKVPPELVYTSMLRVPSIEPGDSLRAAFDFRDLTAFLSNLADEPELKSEKVRQAALQAKELLLHSRMRHTASPDHEAVGNANGFTAYMPWQELGEGRKEEYGELHWSKDTGWPRLLDYIFEPSQVKAEPSAAQSETRLSLGQRLAKGALFSYKKYISPFLGRVCCFGNAHSPSCSQYARQAVEIHGLVEGTKFTALRYLSCHGGYPPGNDPVPGSPPFEGAGNGIPRKKYVITAPVAPKVDRARVSLLSSAAGVAGKLIGGIAGAAVGLCLGVAGGGLVGAKVGNGSIDEFNSKMFAKYQPKAPEKVVDLEVAVAGPAHKMRSWILEKTGRPALANAVGGVLGGISSALVAGLGGAYALGKEGALFGKLLFSNATKDALGYLPPNPANQAILEQDYAAGA